MSLRFLLETLAAAAGNMVLHKLRTALSVLGVLFGIAAVMTVGAVGEGARHELREQIAILGTRSITVRALKLTPEQERRARADYSRGLSPSDALHLRQNNPLVADTAPLREVPFRLFSGLREAKARIIGTTAEYLHIQRLPLTRGRFLTPLDVREKRRVCVVGEEVRKRLFPGSRALGRWLRIGGEWFRVVGILEDRRRLVQVKLEKLRTHEFNNEVFIPLSTALGMVSGEGRLARVDEIAVLAREEALVPQAASLIERSLGQLHHGVRDYEVVVPVELLRQSQRTQQIFNVVVGSLAGVSLFIGGIGIMNIMLANVLERRREIGVRRAVGASAGDIALQFLVEASLMTLAGGALGAAVGSGGAWAVTAFAGWKTVISGVLVGAALSLATVVGVAFGLYPAVRAARLDPIECLRHE